MQQRYSLTQSEEEKIEHEMNCSFCGESGGNRQYMFQASNGLCICDDCVLICTEVMGVEDDHKEQEDLLSLN
jgi:hypothetical protein